ncbi:hypothetical protein THOG11_120178 [Vibrio harveyi]|nr:hypothetical protein TH15OA1_410180 [Vibrio harveyi]CAH1544077.1 hypothetical protein VHARVF571_570083 [Vibrio harveyi]CAH1548553.1 hypothetical protein THOD03_110179 [Vibrio harveyi]CAH1553069.1 hypothetical protein THOG11_120178 [Vibrio harveyi]
MRTWECIGLMLLFAYKSDASKKKILNTIEMERNTS